MRVDSLVQWLSDGGMTNGNLVIYFFLLILLLLSDTLKGEVPTDI